MNAESAADLLRRAADAVLHPPLRPGVTVRLIGAHTSEAWQKRVGRELLVVEHESGSDAVTLWDTEFYPHSGDTIYATTKSVEVVVTDQGKALAAWLSAEADVLDGTDSRHAEAEAVARAILREPQP